MTLREARLRAGLTQVQLASRVGARQNTISAWESGVTQPTARRAQEIEAVLGVPRGTIDWAATANESRRAAGQ